MVGLVTNLLQKRSRCRTDLSEFAERDVRVRSSSQYAREQSILVHHAAFVSHSRNSA